MKHLNLIIVTLVVAIVLVFGGKTVTRKISDLQTKDEKHTKRLNTLSRAVGLIGVLHNENFKVVAGSKDNQIIYINRDWTIDRVPSNLTFEDGELSTIEDMYLKKTF